MKSPQWNVSILRICLTSILSLVVFQSVQVGQAYGLSRGTNEASSAWTTVPLGGGGYVTGLASNADGSAIYCRTDVGGAFRWEPVENDPQGNGSWISMSDHMVPLGTEDADKLMGVESIATDPTLPHRVYVGAGNKIFASGDQGNTWTEILSGLSMAPNSPTTRFFGERLAVDPNNPELIWYGSINDGLQKGVHYRGEWTWTQVPAGSVPFGVPTSSGSQAGVTFVLCDANGGRTITYAGVFDGGANPTTGGVYRTTDGIRWTKVAMASGSFNTPRRAQMTRNGTLYITGGGEGVFKLPRGGVIREVTPISGPYYNGVAVDPNDRSGNTVYVADKASRKIWRSADGGGNWAEQTSINQTRQEPDGTPTLNGYWFGNIASMLVNPADSNELWVSDFFGVARTRDAQNLGTTGSTWYMLQKGQEETVVMDVLNAPTGPRLMTGLADISGFYYNDTTVRPTGAGGGELTNPSKANSTSLDFSEADDDVWVRAWRGNHGGNGSGGYSNDAGKTWLLFGQIAEATMESGDAGWESWDLSTYLATQKAKGVDSVTLVLASDNATDFTRTPVSFASKEASNSSLRPQLVINGIEARPYLPQADTFVAGADAEKGRYFGNEEVLHVAHAYTSNITNDSQVYLKFDLGDLPEITSATLKLHRLDASSGVEYTVGVFACSKTDWTEAELTWKNRPLTYASSNASRNPFAEPRYKSATGVSLAGGRVAASATDPNVLVWLPVGTGNRAYYSHDRGVTWTESTGGPQSEITGVYTNGGSTDMSGQPLASDRVNGDFYMADFGGSKHEIYRSTDGGATWTKASSISNGWSYNMRTPQIVAAPASPSNPAGGDVWVCDDSDYNGKGGGLWRSTDSANSWEALPGVGKVTAVSFGKSKSGDGYAVYVYGYVDSVLGVYQSDDYGASWMKLADPTIKQVTAIAGDRQNYGRVFIGTDGRGVFQY